MGIPRITDYNAGVQFGTGYFQRYIHNGKRVSAAKAFLRPALRRRSTSLRTRSQVVEIVLEGRKAIGIRYRDGTGREQTVRARREIIISAVQSIHPRYCSSPELVLESCSNNSGYPFVLLYLALARTYATTIQCV